jgi:hypothetical protein
MSPYIIVNYGDTNILFGPFTLNQLDAHALFRIAGSQDNVIIPPHFNGCRFSVSELDFKLEYKNMRPRKQEDDRGIAYLIGLKGITREVVHRNGGPALVSNSSGKCYWYVRGAEYTTTREYCKALKYSKIKTMAMMLKHGEILPTHIDMC